LNEIRILLGFLAFFAGMWVGISYLISHLSGWSSLHARFPAGLRPDGERLTWTNARLGAVSFRSCLNMTLSPGGLHMVPSLPFRLFMPPLLVPWREISFAGIRHVLLWDYGCFQLGGADGAILMLFRRTSDRFRPYLAVESARAYETDLRYEGALFDKRLLIVSALSAAVGLAAALLARKLAR
jgi:hypothetical protein